MPSAPPEIRELVQANAHRASFWAESQLNSRATQLEMTMPVVMPRKTHFRCKGQDRTKVKGNGRTWCLLLREVGKRLSLATGVVVKLTIVQLVDGGWQHPSLLFSLHTEQPTSCRST